MQVFQNKQIQRLIKRHNRFLLQTTILIYYRISLIVCTDVHISKYLFSFKAMLCNWPNINSLAVNILQWKLYLNEPTGKLFCVKLFY